MVFYKCNSSKRNKRKNQKPGQKKKKKKKRKQKKFARIQSGYENRAILHFLHLYLNRSTIIEK